MTLSFSPAISLGHSAMPFLLGMPSAEVGPVSGRLTPMVMSALRRQREQQQRGAGDRGDGGLDGTELDHG